MKISLYNTALSAANVLSIFNANDKGKCVAPALLAGDATVLEGDIGTTNLNFTVTAIRSSAPAQVSYATTDGTATQPSDYLTASGLANIPASGSTTVSVTINGDTTLEQNETLFLNLSNPSPFGVNIADAQAVDTIFSDDCTTTPLGIRNAYRAENNANDSAGGAHATLENGAAIPGATVEKTLTVTNGVFNTSLDFGAGAFPGANRSLQIEVKINAGDAYTVLNPRQEILTAPYSIKSKSSENSDQLGGVDSSGFVQQDAGGNVAIDGNLTVSGAVSYDTVNAQTQFNLGGSGFWEQPPEAVIFTPESARDNRTQPVFTILLSELSPDATIRPEHRILFLATTPD